MTLITNTTKDSTVKSIADSILPSCEELFFEVGYFYFSGFKQIYKQLENKKINIMIGIGYDAKVAQLANSNLAIKDSYFDYLRNDINNTDILVQKEDQESYNMFVKKIKDGSLKIKCWKDKNDHSKTFVFKYSKKFNQNNLTPGIVLAGSSNFSKSGFLDNIEGNYLFRDPSEYQAHLKQFLERWNSANCIDIANDENYSEFEKKVIKKTWINKTPKPYNLFIKVLDEYFQEKSNNETLMPKELSDGKFLNIKYQEDAIQKGLDILKKHQGVIIADVVGLGKSVIASAIAKNLNLNTIIIAPPHLVEGWEEYKTTTMVQGSVISRGKIEDAFRRERTTSENLIIIDEAHSFRNDLTKDYSLLHKLCQNNKVILLSATPFNNRPQDIFNMIKLFQIPTKSSLQNIENLSEQFKELVKEYNEITKIDQQKEIFNSKIKEKLDNLTNQIKSILSPLVIRRSRLDLEAIDRYQKDIKTKKIEFPKRNPPILIDYELGDIGELYSDTLDVISPKTEKKIYVAARYKSTSYILPKYLSEIAKRAGLEDKDKELLKKSLENIADFMKRLLVRRFESCIFSFMTTLRNIINSNIIIKDWYDKEGKIPIYKKGFIPSVSEFQEGDENSENLKEFDELEDVQKFKDKGAWFIDKKELNPKFYEDLVNDIEELNKLEKTWQLKISKDFIDPKFEQFFSTLKLELQKKEKRKVLVFSEFADTASYVYKKLKEKGIKVFKYTSEDSTKKINRQIIKKNFDAGINNKEKDNDFDVLVATDTIAEGYNLNRAGTVINYDIPYNPTKVIQRFGRINRVNKKVFDELFIYNFFPTIKGEKEVRTKKIAKIKITVFQALFGDDTKIITSDEKLGRFFEDEFQNASDEVKNPETYFENLIYNLRDEHSEFIDEIRNLPPQIRIGRKVKKNYGSGIVVYAKKGEESIFRFLNSKNEFLKISNDKFLEIFQATEDEKPHQVSDKFEKFYYDISKNLFNKKFITALDIGKKRTLDKLKALCEKAETKYEGYLKDIIFVVENLDALPGGYLKMIREIKLSNLEKEIEKLYLIITPEYLKKIMLKAKKIDEGQEHLIISEEIKNV